MQYIYIYIAREREERERERASEREREQGERERGGRDAHTHEVLQIWSLINYSETKFLSSFSRSLLWQISILYSVCTLNFLNISGISPLYPSLCLYLCLSVFLSIYIYMHVYINIYKHIRVQMNINVYAHQ